MVNIKRQEDIYKIRRDSIIDAAEPIFFKKGFENTTIDEIVKAAEYSKRTVYIYIKSKEEIYDEIAFRGYTKFYNAIKKSISEDDPLKSMKTIWENTINFAVKEKGYANVIINYHIDCKTFCLEEPPRKKILEMDNKVLSEIEKILEKGIEKGVFRKTLDVKFSAIYLVAAYLGTIDIVINKLHFLEKDRDIIAKDYISKSLDMSLHSILNNECL